MFRKLLFLFFVVITIPSYTVDPVLEKVEKKVNIIVDNILDLADILFTFPEIDKIDLEKEFILLLDKQGKKIEEKKKEICEKVSQQDFINRLNKLASFTEKLGLNCSEKKLITE